MSYSIDFREKVLAIKEEKKLSIRETATYFKLGISTVARWLQRIEIKRRPDVPLKINRELLARDVEQYPDSYQYERAARLGVRRSAISYNLRKMKLTCKKNTATSKSKHQSEGNISKKDRFLQKRAKANCLY